METLFKVNYTYDDEGRLTNIEVDKLEVLRRGILPECILETVTCKDKNGRKFLGSPKNYFTTTAEAWAAARREVEESERCITEEMLKQHRILASLEKILPTIPGA